jgi:hypothetical protein
VPIKRVSVIGALGTSAVFAAYDGYLFWTSRAPDEGLFSLHHFVLAFLLATWIVADTTELRRARPSFDYGWFIVAARWITQGDPLRRRLQPFRYHHDCSDYFRLEHLPGGTRTHWKAPPFHGAHPKRSSGSPKGGHRSSRKQTHCFLRPPSILWTSLESACEFRLPHF